MEEMEKYVELPHRKIFPYEPDDDGRLDEL